MIEIKKAQIVTKGKEVPITPFNKIEIESTKVIVNNEEETLIIPLSNIEFIRITETKKKQPKYQWEKDG